MPLYAGAVLIGAARFIEETLKINYIWALIIFTVIIAAYVFAGGIKGVMYTDTLQGTIMLGGMTALLILTYTKLGGFISAHQALTDLASKMPENLVKGGAQGWTTMPALGSSYMVDFGFCGNSWSWNRGIGSASVSCKIYDGKKQ